MSNFRCHLREVLVAGLALLILSAATMSASAQQPGTDIAKHKPPAGHILLTIFLKHDQSKTLDQIGKELDGTDFWLKFPPEGVEVESWYVMMGIGQVVTLRVPPERLRDVNRVIEKTAWGAFRTEFYATYDLYPVVQQIKKKKREAKKK
ncbi:MAG: hypothetical protein AAGF14_04670 [Pseudomonadota bacterium]